MDLDSVADELYAASPDEFVERRKERVTQARAAKERQLVKDIGALRRPTRSAWLVNLLARESPADVSDLLDLGAALGEAQRRASGTDLRRLSKERHTLLEQLTRKAVQLAADRGHAATEATRQEVTQTLQAALSDAAVAALVKAGRVIQPASYGGFGPMDLFGAGMTPEVDTESTGDDDGTATPPAGDHAEDPDETEQPADDPARVEAETAVREAEQAASDAREVAAEAERTAEEATSRADELADRVEELRTQLAAAEAAEREAGEEARAARKQHQQAQRAADAAEEALAQAQQALADLPG